MTYNPTITADLMSVTNETPRALVDDERSKPKLRVRTMIERIEVTAARELNDMRFGVAVAQLPDAVIGMLPLVPGASVTVIVGSVRATGAGVLAIEIQGPRLAPATLSTFAREVSAELDGAFTLQQTRVRARARTREWIVRPSTTRPIGFGGDTKSVGNSAWSAGEDQAAQYQRSAVRWLALAAQYPGLQWRLAVSMDAQAPEQRSARASASVVYSGKYLPLRARALAPMLLPESVVDLEPGGDPTALALSRLDARALVQWPLAHNAALPGIPAAPAQPRVAQPSASQAREPSLRLGTAVLPNGTHTDVVLGVEERLRHTHVIGKTGTGKSSLLAGMMHDLATQDSGFLLLDPHGDLCARVLAELPESARERVWIITAGDVENPTPMNPLAVNDPVQLDIVIQDLVLVFYSLFDPNHTGIVGPRFEALLTNGVRGLRALRGSRASLLDIPRIYRDRKVERAIAQAVTDPQQKEFWRGEMEQLNSQTRSEVVGWFTSKFDRFSNTQAMRGILGTGADAFDPAKAMDDGRIILLDLSKQSLGEVASNMLGFLYLTRFWTGLANRHNRREFDFFIDEAHSVGAASSLTSMLSEGRKWGAAVTVAHQYLGQLDERLGEALAGNVATTIAFRSGPQDARQIIQRTGGELAISDLTTQRDLHALITRTSGDALPNPHTLIVDHNERVTARTGQDLERFVSDIRRRSHRALVDPFRHLAPYDPLVEEQPPRASRPTRVSAPESSRQAFGATAPPSDDGGLLAAWLKKNRDTVDPTAGDYVEEAS